MGLVTRRVIVIDGHRFDAGVSADDVKRVAGCSDSRINDLARVGHFIEGEITADQPTVGSSAIDATDAAIELARQNDIDLATVSGSGAGGRIVVGDVQGLLAEDDDDGDEDLDFGDDDDEE